MTFLSLAWLVGGLYLATHAPLDVFPEFVPPQVTIQTEARGLAPEQVEQIVTRPIESAINGAPGIESMRSESVYGLSVILVSFAEDADPQDTRTGISERLSTLTGTLPAGVSQPRLTPSPRRRWTSSRSAFSPTSSTHMNCATSPTGPSNAPSRRSGIARVTVYGGAIRQLQIQPKIERLTALGLTLNDVSTAVREAIALRGGGFIETNAQRITIDTPPRRQIHSRSVKRSYSMRNGSPIRVSDVADVAIAPAVQVGDATIMGKPGVLITVSGQFGANTLKATEAVEAALAEMTPTLKARGIDVYPTLHRPATFVQRALSNLQQP